jgi:hypothetical protein
MGWSYLLAPIYINPKPFFKAQILNVQFRQNRFISIAYVIGFGHVVNGFSFYIDDTHNLTFMSTMFAHKEAGT